MNIKTMLARVAMSALLAAGAGSGTLAIAQGAYPTKPIQMIVAYPPGGGTDILGRLVAAELGKRLGQPVVVVNKGGASGAIGTELAAHAPADGYTLLLATANITVNPAVEPKTRVDPQRDFVPVTLLSESPFVLVSSPTAKAGSLAELLARTKAEPGTFNYASTGNGSPQQLVTEWLKKDNAGLDWLHVPYQGGGPALNALVSGQVQVMFSNVLPVLPYIKAGTLRPLGVTTRERLSALAHVPTMIEEGQTDFVVSFWSGVVAPAGTPAAIIDKLNTALMTVMRDPALRKRLADEGSIVTPLPTTQFGKYIADDAARWQRIVKIADLRADR